MYQVVVAKGCNQNGWVDITAELPLEPFLHLTKKYTEVRVTITHPTTKELREYRGYPPISDIPNLTATQTFNDWLAVNGNKQIFGWGDITDWSDIRRTYYCNAANMGFQVLATNGDTHPLNVDGSISKYSDLSLYHESFTQWGQIAKTMIASVNGLLFPIKDQGDWISIPQGKRPIDKDNLIDVGLLSFEDIGDIQTQRLIDLTTPEKVRVAEQSVILNAPELKDTTWFLVINGRLIPHTKFAHWLDNDNLMLKLKHLNLHAHLVEDSERLGFSHSNPWFTDDLSTREGIWHILTSVNTFIIKFTSPVDIYVEEKILHPIRANEKVLSYHLPDSLMVRGDGRGISGYVVHNGNPSVPYVVSGSQPITPRFWEDEYGDKNAKYTGVHSPYIGYKSHVVKTLDLYSV
jgi:hypothetical protein